MGKLAALVRRDVGACRARNRQRGGENDQGLSSEHAPGHRLQLFCAPAATHSTSAHFAAELMDPDVGMLPPKSLRHDLPCTLSVDEVPLMYPCC